MKKKCALQNFLKLPNIHPFVPKLVPGLGSSFKRSCIVEVLKEQKDIITQQSKPIISEIYSKNKKKTDTCGKQTAVLPSPVWSSSWLSEQQSRSTSVVPVQTRP